MWNGSLDNTEEVLLYMNSELSKGRSQKDIEVNDFKVKQGVIKNRLNRRGYKKIENQWIASGDNGNTGVIKNEVGVVKPSNIQSLEDNKTYMEKYDNNNTEIINNKNNKYDNNNTLVIKDEDMKNNLINLAKNYDKIMNLINEYDKKYDKEYDNIVIELPIETNDNFRTSIRVNNVIWEQFSSFVDTHKEFTKRDLLSMALKEYINNHK